MGRRRRGSGSIHYDRTRRRWVAVLDVGTHPRTGNRQRRKVTTPTQAEAQAALAELIERQQAGQDLQRRPTVESVYRLWTDRIERTPATKATYASLAENHILPVLGDRPIEDVNIEEIERWLDARGELSAATLQKLRNVLAQVFDLAMRRRIVTSNPARLALLPTGTRPAKRGHSLTAEEARALLDAADGRRLGAFVVLGLYTGARPGELAALQWSDVDLEAATVTIRPSKTGTSRTLRLPAEAVEALRAHRRRQAEELAMLGDRWPP